MQDGSTHSGEGRSQIMNPKTIGTVVVSLATAALLWVANTVSSHDKAIAELQVRTAANAAAVSELSRMPERLARIEERLDRLLQQQDRQGGR